MKKVPSIILPLNQLKYLYISSGGKKLVMEVDIKFLKQVNEPTTIHEMVAEAKLEYFSGKTKAFNDTKKLLRYLKN